MTLWGSLLSSLLFAAALCLLYRSPRAATTSAIARRTVLYLAIFPLSFVFSLPYAESLFLLLALAALRAHLARPLVVGCAGRRAGRARPAGRDRVLPALAWRRYRSEGRRWRAYLPLLLLPAAELAFFLYLGWRTGNFMASPDAQVRGWGRGVSVLPWVLVYTLWHDVLETGHLRFLVHIGLHAALVRPLLPAWRMKIPGEYLIFARALVILPTSGGLLVSMGRFGMVAFPFFWALADLGSDERVDTLVKTVVPAAVGGADLDHLHGRARSRRSLARGRGEQVVHRQVRVLAEPGAYLADALLRPDRILREPPRHGLAHAQVAGRERVRPAQAAGHEPVHRPAADAGERDQVGPDRRVVHAREVEIGLGERRIARIFARERPAPSRSRPATSSWRGNANTQTPSARGGRPAGAQPAAHRAGREQRDLLGRHRGDERLERVGDERRAQAGGARGDLRLRAGERRQIEPGAEHVQHLGAVGGADGAVARTPSADMRTTRPERSTRYQPPSCQTLAASLPNVRNRNVDRWKSYGSGRSMRTL